MAVKFTKIVIKSEFIVRLKCSQTGSSVKVQPNSTVESKIWIPHQGNSLSVDSAGREYVLLDENWQIKCQANSRTENLYEIQYWFMGGHTSTELTVKDFKINLL